METPVHESENSPDLKSLPPFRIIALRRNDGKEPPTNLTDREGTAAWVAATAAWHPSLLAQADALPRLEEVTLPSDPLPGDVLLVENGQMAQLPAETRRRAEEAGVPIIEALDDRLATVRRLLDQAPDPSMVLDPGDLVGRDYLALGAAFWWLRDLTIAMGHVDTLSHQNLFKEAGNGARTWRLGDQAGAINRLRASFELITEARERFYPLDGYIIDLCLLDPASPAGSLKLALESHTPVTLLAPASAIAAASDLDPDSLLQLREAITEGWADVVGGAYSEVDEPFLPWSSLSWQFREGARTYRLHLDDRNVETLTRRRFGLYPQLAQLARRFGLRFAVYGALDSGRFPIPPDAKRLWASPDGTTLESITRSPIGADRASEGVKLPWRIGRSMRDDSSSLLVMAHWPDPVAPWYEDYRRTAAYSPVFSRWVTVNDFFHRSDRPFEEIQPTLDEYASAYLAQAVSRRDPSPISGRARHARTRAQLDAAIAMQALVQALDESHDRPPLDSLEFDLETRTREVATEVEATSLEQAQFLATRIVGEGSSGRPGYLVINPTGIARKARVLLPEAAPDLRPEGPLRSAQFTEEGVWAVVDLPAFGYSWVPRDAQPDRPLAGSSGLSIRDRTLTNEFMSVSIDPATGGIRGLQLVGEDTPRIGQQIVISGLVGKDGKPSTSLMRSTSYQADYGGPTLVQATSSGTLHDPSTDRPLASFRQRLRLWQGRPSLEIEIQLSQVDPTWLARLAESDPWTHHLACRWAWPDALATLRRTALLSPSATQSDRPETSEAFELTSRQRRTTLLFGGLAHHRRQGARMLDTILVAGSESARDFTLGVALDLEHLFPASIDFTAPTLVVPTNAGPPRTGPTGWLLQVDHKSVAIVGVTFTDQAGEREGRGLIVDLIETSGKPSRCRVRAFRDPIRARQVNGLGDHIVDLATDGDGVLVDLTPHEIARIEITLTESPEIPTD